MKAHRRIAKKEVRAPGRPRAFDPEKALDEALRVFWEHGYEGASLTDLTSAMGINRPSMYAAFGNKEELFRKVLDRYAKDATNYVREALREPTARGAVKKLLLSAADALGDAGHPRGCLLVQGAMACGDESDAVRRELCSRRAAGEAAIRARLESAKAEGDLPAGVNAAELAGYVTTVLHGMSVQAAGGASREKLLRIGERAMKAWPAVTNDSEAGEGATVEKSKAGGTPLGMSQS
jgi:AcrR family transcriptional regulator